MVTPPPHPGPPLKDGKHHHDYQHATFLYTRGFPEALVFKGELSSVTLTCEKAFPFHPHSHSLFLVPDITVLWTTSLLGVIPTCALPTLICFGLHLVGNGAGDLKIREQGDPLGSLKVHGRTGKMSCATQKDLGGIRLKDHHIAFHFRDGDTGLFTEAPI